MRSASTGPAGSVDGSAVGPDPTGGVPGPGAPGRFTSATTTSTAATSTATTAVATTAARGGRRRRGGGGGSAGGGGGDSGGDSGGGSGAGASDGKGAVAPPGAGSPTACRAAAANAPADGYRRSASLAIPIAITRSNGSRCADTALGRGGSRLRWAYIRAGTASSGNGLLPVSASYSTQASA
jgi:hypothetical protein